MTRIALPQIGTPDTVAGGRSTRDGYQRGWGLMHAGLMQAVAEHPLYREAAEASGGWSLLVEAKRMNLALPGLALAHQLYISLKAQGHGRDGTHALLLALAAASGIDWRKR